MCLDDQSVHFPGRNIDVHMADMERIEVLEGPQGTLFGGGTKAGAICRITHKPALGRFSGSDEAGYRVTAPQRPEPVAERDLQCPRGERRLRAAGGDLIFFDPVDGFGTPSFVINGHGVELQPVAGPVSGLTLQASSSWNSANQESVACLPVSNPDLVTAGQCITATYKDAISVHPIVSPPGRPDTRCRRHRPARRTGSSTSRDTRRTAPPSG